MDTDVALAEKLCWHKTALFPRMSLKVFATMSDKVLNNFAFVVSKQLANSADKRKTLFSELEEWEKENGQDALYWSIKVEFDRELLVAAMMVIDRQNAVELIRKRIVGNAEWRWLNSHLDNVDDNVDDEDF